VLVTSRANVAPIAANVEPIAANVEPIAANVEPIAAEMGQTRFRFFSILRQLNHQTSSVTY